MSWRKRWAKAVNIAQLRDRKLLISNVVQEPRSGFVTFIFTEEGGELLMFRTTQTLAQKIIDATSEDNYVLLSDYVLA